MKKNNKLTIFKNIILFIILIVMIGIIINTISLASEVTNYADIWSFMDNAELDDTIMLNLDDLYYSKDSNDLTIDRDLNYIYAHNNFLYCIQKGGSQTFRSKVKYKLTNKIRIEGSYAKSEIKSNETGENLQTNNDYNAKFSFLLGDYTWWSVYYGYGTDENIPTARQQNVWLQWKEWYANSGSKLGIRAWDSKDYKLPNNAENQLETNINNYMEKGFDAEVISNVGTIIDCDNDKLGPFNISYTGDISSIVVKDTDGNVIENTNLGYYQNDMWTSDIYIEPEKDFYIYNNTEKVVKDITINVSNDNFIRNVDIWILENSNYQQLMIAKPIEGTKIEPASLTIEVSNSESTSTLRVVKYGINEDGDINKAKKQTGVGFIIFKEGNGYLKYIKNNTNAQVVLNGKMEYNTTDFEWIADRNNATIFETVNTDDGWTGYFQIENIPTGTYYIGEVYNENEGYEYGSIELCNIEKYVGEVILQDAYVTDIQINDNIEGYTENKMQVVKVVVDDATILRVYDNLNEAKEDFDIYINKVNPSGNKLKGAEFKVKVFNDNEHLGWLYYDLDKEQYYYNNDLEESTTWITSEGISKDNLVYAENQGDLSILGLDLNYEYEIYELEPAEDYLDLIDQTTKGMEVSINGKVAEVTEEDNYVLINHTTDAIYCGTVSYQENGSIVRAKVTNIKENDDGPKKSIKIEGNIWIDKKGTKDDEFDGIYNSTSEQLYKKSVKVSLINSSGKTVKGPITISDGTYNIDTGISIRSTASKELIVNKLENYSIKFEYDKNYALTTPNFEQKDGSKTLNGVDPNDMVMEGIAYIYNLSDYVNLCYSGTTLDYMNMGLCLEDDEDSDIEKDVAYIKAKIKGKEYVYYYGTKNNGTGGLSEVNIGNASYYRTIYASDIAYTMQGGSEGLEVYITYVIKITNNFKTYTSRKRDISITTTVTDIYNDYYYQLSSENDRSILKEENDYWKKGSGRDGLATVTYNNHGVDTLTISRGDTKKLYITFKLTNNALEEVLEKGTFTGNNRVEVEGTRKYKIKRHSKELGWYWTTRNKSYGPKQDPAPGMKFSIFEQDGTEAQRTISGIVFEDNRLDDIGEVVGNGQYDTSENIIENVTVELLEISGNKINGEGVVAKRYIRDTNEAENYKILDKEEAAVNTDSSGNYTFTGIVPR